MQLFENDLFVLKQCAISAAFQAGHIIGLYDKKQIEISRKATGSSEASSVVTEVDFLSQKVILDILKPTCDIFDIALLTEESVDDRNRFEKDYFWCIDPLDGTLPYIESVDGHSVSIALVRKDGVSQLGVIFNPFTNTLYHATMGMGAFKNNTPFVLPQGVVSGKITFITDRSFLKHAKYDETLLFLNRLAEKYSLKGVEVIAQGGAAMNALWCIENYPACYFKFPKDDDKGGSIWDYSASSCICAEVGIDVSDIYGDPLELNRRESTFMNHKGFLFSNHPVLTKDLLAFFAMH